ncbi:MAG TPA: nickel-dependent hydrogenase large subunit [Euzebyales bacterium]|nr:nickel-dependent hydrogenase large subunit [Euzebyales bacterium]
MTHQEGWSRTLSVEALARVEGEGAMRVRVHDGQVTDVQLRIYEPPRFFEALLRGRSWTEPPDITARICGICPIAYQMSACQALEDACGVTVDAPLQDLRRLLYCGEWISSHALHVYLLHAPDFLGYESAIEMAAEHRVVVERGLRLRKAGTDLLTLVGGRESHPVNVRVGGFYRAPTRRELASLRPRLEQARDDAFETVRLVAGFDVPDFTQDVVLVALSDPDRYAIERGRLASTAGLDAPVAAFSEHVTEHHVAHSNALHAELDGGTTFAVGPMARFALNFDRLSPVALEAAALADIGPDCRNPFRSIVVRSIETLYAIDEALRLIDGYERPERPFVPIVPRAATGHGATEAPRGTLYHRYTIGDDGLLTDGVIVPPTSQNQRSIEEDLARFVQARLDMDDDALQWACEQAIRNYDPCISCATHFLDLTIERT